MLDSTLVLETDRVRLEPIGVAHLDDLRRNCNDPALWEFTYSADPFDTLERAQRWLREAVADRTCTFAIRDLAWGETIGSTRYFDITPEHRKLEIGYTFIARRFWRTHVNTHCKLLLLQYAFESWHAARVQLKGERSTYGRARRWNASARATKARYATFAFIPKPERCATFRSTASSRANGPR